MFSFALMMSMVVVVVVMMMMMMLQELQQVKDGSYISELQRIVAFGSGHVVKCDHCSACGFVCEICNDASDVIYPFDVANTATVRAFSASSDKALLSQ